MATTSVAPPNGLRSLIQRQVDVGDRATLGAAKLGERRERAHLAVAAKTIDSATAMPLPPWRPSTGPEAVPHIGQDRCDHREAAVWILPISRIAAGRRSTGMAAASGVVSALPRPVGARPCSGLGRPAARPVLP
jgi:hypothetical protein